jgi:hypothetical protein
MNLGVPKEANGYYYLLKGDSAPFAWLTRILNDLNLFRQA